MELKMKLGGPISTKINDKVRQKLENYLAQKVGGMKCPDHHMLPTILVEGESLDAVHFDVTGCCQKIIVMVKQELGG